MSLGIWDWRTYINIAYGIKNGYVKGKQRYKCKNCSKTYREGDEREKYTNEQRLKVLKWYLEGAGIMSIERMEGVPNPLIIQWIRKFSKIIRQKLNENIIAILIF